MAIKFSELKAMKSKEEEEIFLISNLKEESNIYPILKVPDFFKRGFEKKSSDIVSVFPANEIIDNQSVSKGITDNFFYDFLKSNNFENIHKDISIASLRYNPDVIYYDAKNGVKMDIEIDEPYIYNTKTPIHYIGSNDEERDQAFVAQGWIVIRFSEKQIITQTQQCVNYLRSAILKYSLTNGMLEACSFEIIGTPRWSQKEAIEMANRNSRYYYLPKPLLTALKKAAIFIIDE